MLSGKRILVTEADAFVGPALCEVLSAHGAEVIANTDCLVEPDAPAAIVAAAGRVDVLIASLAHPAPPTAATEVEDEEWRRVFAALVDPREDAEFAAFLCSDAANCFVGQVFPVCGGWVMR